MQARGILSLIDLTWGRWYDDIYIGQRAQQ